MEENKTLIVIVAVVAIVAIFGMVFTTKGTSLPLETTKTNIAGHAIKSAGSSTTSFEFVCIYIYTDLDDQQEYEGQAWVTVAASNSQQALELAKTKCQHIAQQRDQGLNFEISVLTTGVVGQLEVVVYEP